MQDASDTGSSLSTMTEGAGKHMIGLTQKPTKECQIVLIPLKIDCSFKAAASTDS